MESERDHDDEYNTEEEEEHDGVTFQVLILTLYLFLPELNLLQDIKQILPTCLILIVTVIIMVTVIPYAFSSVIQ